MSDLEAQKEISVVKYDNKIIDVDGIVIETLPSQKENTNINGESSQLREILNSLLPPKPYKKHKHKFKQVSSIQSSRNDVLKLQKLWDDELQQRQARETGICPIRFV